MEWKSWLCWTFPENLKVIFNNNKDMSVRSCVCNAFLARLNNVQEELLYYPGVGVSGGVRKCLSFML